MKPPAIAPLPDSQKRGHVLRRIIPVFTLVLIGYVAVFYWVEHRRVAKGPWVVTFTTEADRPALVVNQHQLGIRDVRITFSAERTTTNTAQRLEFAQVRPVPFAVPFGRCIFLDPLFLPGTVVLDVFGHEVQLMPRVLTIDKVERPWKNGDNIQLPSAPPRAKTGAP